MAVEHSYFPNGTVQTVAALFDRLSPIQKTVLATLPPEHGKEPGTTLRDRYAALAGTAAELAGQAAISNQLKDHLSVLLERVPVVQRVDLAALVEGISADMPPSAVAARASRFAAGVELVLVRGEVRPPEVAAWLQAKLSPLQQASQALRDRAAWAEKMVLALTGEPAGERLSETQAKLMVQLEHVRDSGQAVRLAASAQAVPLVVLNAVDRATSAVGRTSSSPLAQSAGLVAATRHSGRLSESSDRQAMPKSAAMAERDIKSRARTMHDVDAPARAAGRSQSVLQRALEWARSMTREQAIGSAVAAGMMAGAVGLAMNPEPELSGSDALRAAQVAKIQAVMSSPAVHVELAGSGPASSRQSLRFIATQAINQDVSGFAIEAVGGKYEIEDVPLEELKALHREAGGRAAEEMVKHAMQDWADGKPATGLTELVPEDVKRLLRAPVSLSAAEAIKGMLDDETVRRHGQQYGERVLDRVLKAQGVHLDQPAVEQIAQDGGLKVLEPNRDRGTYSGAVVAQDHRATLVKVSSSLALVVPHRELPEGVDTPEKGSVVKVSYRGGSISGLTSNRRDQSVGR